MVPVLTPHYAVYTGSSSDCVHHYGDADSPSWPIPPTAHALPCHLIADGVMQNVVLNVPYDTGVVIQDPTLFILAWVAMTSLVKLRTMSVPRSANASSSHALSLSCLWRSTSSRASRRHRPDSLFVWWYWGGRTHLSIPWHSRVGRLSMRPWVPVVRGQYGQIQQLTTSHVPLIPFTAPRGLPVCSLVLPRGTWAVELLFRVKSCGGSWYAYWGMGRSGARSHLPELLAVMMVG
ncbi:hypothetical protein C8Q70DRAFT_936294 [Cubamyces menziesii]|nr:hypothetical protein C8Q70DRAFT_936294 [Cubamyces menziesii]